MEESFKSLRATIKVIWFEKMRKECKWYPVCPMKRFYEQGKLDKKWIESYCKGDWETCIRYQMEEKGEPHSDFMLPDGTLMENNKDY